jgi:hypothetical protein
MQVVRKLEIRTRTWRRGVMGRMSFEAVVGEFSLSAS